MLVVMKNSATPEQVEAVNARIRSLGLEPHPIPGAQRVAIGITGNKGALDPAQFDALDAEVGAAPRGAGPRGPRGERRP